MIREHVQTWLETVLGGLAGWINLRAIHPDQTEHPHTAMVESVGEAVAWCARNDGHGFNLYAGLARRGELRDQHGRVDASEKNLAGCQVVWVDLDDGDRDQQLAMLRSFPLHPTLIVDSGGGYHGIWRLEDPVECASDPESNAQLRRVLKGLQVALCGDPAVVDPARIFRVAGTMNYPNARKRQLGRETTQSSLVEASPYNVTLDDLSEYEADPERHGRPIAVYGHAEELPPAVEITLKKVPRMREVFFCDRRLAGKSPSDEDFAIAGGLIRHAPWLDDALIVAALRYRRHALAHLVKGSEKSAGYFPTTVSKARRVVLSHMEAPDFEVSRARWFQWALSRALEPQRTPVVQQGEIHVVEPCRIESSVAELDTETGGGLYGFTALAGDSGVGKSLLALNAALIAKRCGWDVLYVAAEMDAADYAVRSDRFGAEAPRIAHVSDGLDLDALFDLVLTTPTNHTERFLLVLDSITKIAAFVDRESSGDSFFASMAKLTRLCEGAVRYGERRISVIATSELNKDREALGRRITYASSLQVNLMADKDQPDLVNISIPKARYSKKCGAFGPFMHNWRRHRLEKIGGVESEYREKEAW